MHDSFAASAPASMPAKPPQFLLLPAVDVAATAYLSVGGVATVSTHGHAAGACRARDAEIKKAAFQSRAARSI